MIGKPLFEVLDILLTQHPNATVLVDGNSLCGDFAPFIRSGRGKFVFIRDDMATGTAVPEILSSEFVALRAKELNYLTNKRAYTSADYEWEIAADLRSIAEQKGTEIILVQFDCYVSQIWQLTMQAYIEQLGIADHITRVVFCEKCIKKFRSEFVCSRFDRIPVTHSYEAYCRVVCQHKKVKLSQFKISAKAIESYLDINSADGKLAEYIRSTSSTFDSPYGAVCQFLRDFPRVGLGDADFLRIAVHTLEKDGKFNDLLKKWAEVFKAHRR